LLLTDVIMPGMSGRDLAKHLTALHPYLRVLYMSGYTDNVIGENGILEEGLCFLQKPFAPQALTQRVRETLDRPVAAD
jgi:FixJ family two-component response regulator